ncbi:hypothetical protein [Primorskyibacter marinus]|uniref:hypothetical protein n=1 Tax=Primorskyibacter marinus TaxID=1977320 RepID=UPI0013006F70|nr:hypothetical protein [Primorskyibacter marinus]
MSYGNVGHPDPKPKPASSPRLIRLLPDYVWLETLIYLLLIPNFGHIATGFNNIPTA